MPALKTRLKESFLIKNSFELLLIALACLAFISPQLAITSPTLIDDGSDLLSARDYEYAALITHTPHQPARFWPLKLIYRKLLLDLFGLNIPHHFLFQSLILFVMISLTYRLLVENQVQQSFALGSSLLIIFLPSTVANLYRLGTVEHLQTMFVLLGLFLLQKRRHYLAYTIFIINLLVKESSFFFLLIPLLSLCWLRKKRQVLPDVVGVLFFALAHLFIVGRRLLLVTDEYVDRYGLAFKNFDSILATSPFTVMVLLFGAVYFIYQTLSGQKLEKKVLLFYLSIWVANLPFFIWNAHQIYYHLAAQVLACLFITLLLSKLIQRWPRLKYGLVAVFLIIFIWINKIGRVLQMGLSMHQNQMADSAVSQFILNNNWQGFNVYIAVRSLEPNDKIRLYFMNWPSNDQHPAMVYPDVDLWDSIEMHDQTARSMIVQNARKKFAEDPNPNKVMIEPNYHAPLEPGTTQSLCAYSPFVGKICQYAAVLQTSEPTDTN